MSLCSTWEAEAGASQVQRQPGLYSETLPQKNKIKLTQVPWFMPIIPAIWEMEIVV
jgi:hypothetical protein